MIKILNANNNNNDYNSILTIPGITLNSILLQVLCYFTLAHS